MFMKYDHVAVVEDIRIYNSLILHVHNGERQEILTAYADLNGSTEVQK